MDDERLIPLLASIDRRLALLTAVQERDMRRVLQEELLRTRGRVAMFNSFDGVRTTAEVAKAAGVSVRAVQLFVKEMIDLGILSEVGSSAARGLVAAHDEYGIVRWYVGRDAS